MGAIKRTEDIAQNLRAAISRREGICNRSGLSREESDRVQEVMHQGGDHGTVILMAGVCQMLAHLLLDFGTVLNIHVLSQAARERQAAARPEAARRRRTAAAFEGLIGSPRRRRTSDHGKRRGHGPEGDGSSLVQTSKGIVNGKQLGPIPAEEAQKIAADLWNMAQKEQDPTVKTLLRMELHKTALRNMRSKVPAMREVARMSSTSLVWLKTLNSMSGSKVRDSGSG